MRLVKVGDERHVFIVNSRICMWDIRGSGLVRAGFGGGGGRVGGWFAWWFGCSHGYKVKV